ncbi:MAG TPA: hypothetical protein VNL14_03475 [Candidatus Acidoferrales bacterium]|nr:hypothetical protein [Candidatus Acidoferrales bacterium]
MDTNIIIEAVRARCWNALASHFSLETVERCLEEALTGDPLRPDYVQINPTQLKKGVSKSHPVSSLQTAQLALVYPAADELDPGERELLAHAMERTDDWTFVCADRAAVKAAFALGWMERVVSLEALAKAAGVRPTLKFHFTERWLSGVRTAFLLEQPK